MVLNATAVVSHVTRALDHLHVDQGTNYTSKEMKSNLEASDVTLHEDGIETPVSIGTVQRYHGPLRAAYTRIGRQLGRETTYADHLTMAVFAGNTTIAPEDLCPTFKAGK